MKVLLRYPTLPAAVLQGELSDHDLPAPTSVLQPGNLQSLSEFWQAMGGKPRAALNYTVTISIVPNEPAAEAPLVTETVVAMKPNVRREPESAP
jgi:hypothetical protein